MHGLDECREFQHRFFDRPFPVYFRWARVVKRWSCTVRLNSSYFSCKGVVADVTSTKWLSSCVFFALTVLTTFSPRRFLLPVCLASPRLGYSPEKQLYSHIADTPREITRFSRRSTWRNHVLLVGIGERSLSSAWRVLWYFCFLSRRDSIVVSIWNNSEESMEAMFLVHVLLSTGITFHVKC